MPSQEAQQPASPRAWASPEPLQFCGKGLLQASPPHHTRPTASCLQKPPGGPFLAGPPHLPQACFWEESPAQKNSQPVESAWRRHQQSGKEAERAIKPRDRRRWHLPRPEEPGGEDAWRAALGPIPAAGSSNRVQVHEEEEEVAAAMAASRSHEAQRRSLQIRPSEEAGGGAPRGGRGLTQPQPTVLQAGEEQQQSRPCQGTPRTGVVEGRPLPHSSGPGERPLRVEARYGARDPLRTLRPPFK